MIDFHFTFQFKKFYFHFAFGIRMIRCSFAEKSEPVIQHDSNSLIQFNKQFLYALILLYSNENQQNEENVPKWLVFESIIAIA